jgi:hypothetical protein
MFNLAFILPTPTILVVPYRHITAAHTGLCLHLLHVLQRAAVRRNRHLEAQSLWKARVQLDTPLTLTLRHCWPSVTEQSEPVA